MRQRGKVFLTFAAAVVLASAAHGEEGVSASKTAQPAPVVDVLPKASPGPNLDKLKAQILRMIAAHDAETGEFRAATPAEQAQLRSNIAARSAPLAAPADPTIHLPNGAMALPADISQLEFLKVERHVDGAVTFNCTNPLHDHQSRRAGRKGGNVNEQ